MLQTRDVGVYGAGLYSFFDDYNNCESPTLSFPGPPPTPPTAEIPNTNTPQACSFPQFSNCQPSTFSIEGPQTSNINIYNLNTVGASSMASRDGKELASAVENTGVFPDEIAVLRVG